MLLLIINKGEITVQLTLTICMNLLLHTALISKDLRDDENIVINREWIINKLSENENE